MLSLDEFRRKAGFDLDTFIVEVKRNIEADTQKKFKVRVYLDSNSSQAMSRYAGDILEVHMAPRDVIRTQKPELSEPEITAKYKAAFIEEACHGIMHETNHDERVVGCTIGEMRKHMTLEEQSLPYIEQKIQKLREASQPIVGTPVNGAGEFSAEGAARHISHDIQSGLSSVGHKIEEYSRYP